MDTDHLIRVAIPQAGGHARPDVSTLGGEALVSQAFGHEFGPHVGHFENLHAPLLRAVGKSKAGERRRHHVERVRRVAAMAAGVG